MAKQKTRKKKTAKTKWPRIKPETRKDGTRTWQVDARFSLDGRITGRRLWFDAEEEAKEAARQIRVRRENEGKSALALSREELAAFRHANRLLEPLGASLIEAAEFYTKHLHERAGLEQRTVQKVVDEFLDNPTKRAKGGGSPRYEADLKSRLQFFASDFGAQMIGEITTRELDDWLAGLHVTKPSAANFGKPVSPHTRANFRRVVFSLFNFARKRGYTRGNPVEDTAMPNLREGEVGILSPEETRAVLDAACSAILPAFAIGAFAGLRTAETEALDWREIDLEAGYIEVRAKNAKMRKRRLVPIPDNLRAWLTPLVQREGKVWPKNGRKHRDDTLKAAGFGSPHWLTEDERKAGLKLKPWPKNALRHSYASYHLAHHQDSAALSLQLGHPGDGDMLFAHYRQLVKPAAAAAYWDIFPHDHAGVVVAMGKTA
jgi:integrase